MAETKKTITVKLRYLKIATRKVRFVADVVRGLSLREAESQLLFSPRRASADLLKLLHSAAANAKQQKLNVDKLLITEVRVDQGPKQKRWMPRARGSASPIEKRTSHVTIVLKESDAVRPVKFVIHEKPKKKAEKEKKAKSESKDKKKEERIEGKTKQAKEPSVFRKMFRRKSI